MARALATFLVTLLYVLAPQVAHTETIAKNAQDRARMEKIMAEVVVIRPNSALDHYIYSQILNEAGKHHEAIKALETAKLLDPKCTFTSQHKLQEYEALLAKSPMIAESKPVPMLDNLPLSAPPSWGYRRPLQLTICLAMIVALILFIRFVRSLPNANRNLRLFNNSRPTRFRAN